MSSDRSDTSSATDVIQEGSSNHDDDVILDAIQGQEDDDAIVDNSQEGDADDDGKDTGTMMKKMK